MSNDYTEAELAMMSPQEREAIDLELNDTGPSEFIDDADAATSNAAKIAADDAKAEAKATQDVTDAAAKPATPDADAEPATPVADPAPTPTAEIPNATPFVAVFRAPLITDAQHAAAETMLAKKFEDGELTVTQFQSENSRLTQAKVKSDMAVQGAEQAEQQTWDYQQDLYFAQAGNAVLREDPRFWSMMQAELQVRYADPAQKNKSNMEYLTEAGAEVKKLLGLSTAATTAHKAAGGTKPAELDGVDIPKTLEGLPAAGANVDTGSGGEFAHMETLEGMDYEFAFAKMSKEQQARFLAA